LEGLAVRIMVTGGGGMLGRSLARVGANDTVEHELIFVSRADADLRDRDAVDALVSRVQPDAIIHAAARVGGIAANIADPVGFLRDNLAIDSAVIGAALDRDVHRLVYIGSSCIYPRDYRQPLVEDDILAAPLEPTNEGYALAKIAGMKLCEYASTQYGRSFRTVIPSNLYGPDDHFSVDKGHLIAAALLKTHQAASEGAATVGVWGDGTARREFTYVDDVARWLLTHVHTIDDWPARLNLGAGTDHTVAEYYREALAVVGFEGELDFDRSRPVGMKQKLMDSSVARGLGWEPTTELAEGMRNAYANLLDTLETTA